MTYDAKVGASRVDTTEIPTLAGSEAFTGTRVFQRPNAGDQAAVFGVNAEGNFRLAMLASGILRWGPGNAGADVFMERAAGATMRVTSDAFQILNTSGNGSAGLTIRNSDPTGPVVTSIVEGEVGARLIATADGKLAWGDGTLAADTFLERTWAGELTVSGDFGATGKISSTNGGMIGNDQPTAFVGFYGQAPVQRQAAVTPASAQGGGYVQADVQSIADAVNEVIIRLKTIGITNW